MRDDSANGEKGSGLVLPPREHGGARWGVTVLRTRRLSRFHGAARPSSPAAPAPLFATHGKPNLMNRPRSAAGKPLANAAAMARLNFLNLFAPRVTAEPPIRGATAGAGIG
jgi:hypothetical protein